MRRFAVGVAIGAVCLGCGDAAPPADPAAASQEFSATADNRAPVVESVRIEPREPAPGATLRAVVTARDPDGQPVTLAHHWYVDGAEQEATEPTFELSDAAKGAEIRVSVSASDGEQTSDAVDASVSVIDRPPTIISAVLVSTPSVAPGEPITARADAIDPDGDAVDFEYTWFVNGEQRSEGKSLFQTDGLKKGDVIYAEVRATDGNNWTDRQRTPVLTIGSGHPEITSTPPGLREDGVYRYQVVAVDPDGDKRLRYSLEKGPAGMAIDDISGELIWRPHNIEPGVHPVVVVVRDSGGLETKQSFSVRIQREEVAAPEATKTAAAKGKSAPAAREED